MKNIWLLMLVIAIGGLLFSGCGRKTPGVRMCEKTVAETGEKKDCQDEYNKKSKNEKEMMDSMGKVVMEKCGNLKQKEYEECYNEAAAKGMSGKLKGDVQEVIDDAKEKINENTKGMRKNMKDMREDVKDDMKE